MLVFPRRNSIFSPCSLLLSAALALLLPGSIQSQVHSKAQQSSGSLGAEEMRQLQEAAAADDAGRPQDAAVILRRLESRHPDNFDVVEELGLVLAEADDLEHAFPLLKRAVMLRPSSAVAHANLGAIELKLKRTAEAVVSLRKAAELDAKNAQNHTALGAALMQINKPAEAAQAFAAASTLGPSDPDILYNWSVALVAAGQAGKAAEVAARIPNPEASAQVQSLLGDIAEHQNNFKEAAQHYQQAANLDPSEANIYVLGMEFVRHWTFEPAMKIFDYGLSRYPASEHLLAGKGIAKYANNNYEEAAAIFSSLLGKDPDNALYAQILGRSCNLMPNATEGCNALVDFARKHASNAEANTYAAASILHRPVDSQDLGLAEELLTRAVAADPKLASAYFQLGMLRQQQNQWEQSKAALEKCAALDPSLSKAHYRLSLAYSHTGDKEKARAQLALYQKYSQQEKDQANARLEEVTTFLVSNK